MDAGSSDPGPYYLGAGVSFTDRGAVGRDLSILLAAAVEHGIPVVIGTAGGSGANAHLEWCLHIVREIARAQNLHFPAAAIRAEIPREAVLAALRAGRVSPLGPAPELTEAALADTARVVGQMGLEPIQRALAGGVQVVVAGRAYDPSVFAALPVLEGYDRGLAIHLASSSSARPSPPPPAAARTACSARWGGITSAWSPRAGAPLQPRAVGGGPHPLRKVKPLPFARPRRGAEFGGGLP